MSNCSLKYVDHSYCDYSRYVESGGDLIKHKKSGNNFPARLHRMLSDSRHSHIIAWMPHGRAFKILDKDKLLSEVLPQYYSSKKYESFSRQLNGWGFKRLHQSGPDHGCYYHQSFLRDMPLLTCLVRRLPPNTGKSIPFAEGEPNFYRISEKYPLPPRSSAERDASGVPEGGLDLSYALAKQPSSPKQKPSVPGVLEGTENSTFADTDIEQEILRDLMSATPWPEFSAPSAATAAPNYCFAAPESGHPQPPAAAKNYAYPPALKFGHYDANELIHQDYSTTYPPAQTESKSSKQPSLFAAPEGAEKFKSEGKGLESTTYAPTQTGSKSSKQPSLFAAPEGAEKFKSKGKGLEDEIGTGGNAIFDPLEPASIAGPCSAGLNRGKAEEASFPVIY